MGLGHPILSQSFFPKFPAKAVELLECIVSESLMDPKTQYFWNGEPEPFQAATAVEEEAEKVRRLCRNEE